MNQRTESHWQEDAIREVTALLRPDEGVRALAMFGTAAGTEPDVWSDIDLLLVVDEAARERFHPALEWLQPLGEVYTWDQSESPWWSVTRACFADFRRFDFVITTEAALGQIDRWSHVPFWRGTRVLFSRSPVVDAVLARPFPHPAPPLISPDEFQQMQNGFWFKGMLAVQKVMRDDRLIALHLALEMVQECAVLGMLLRDRAEGTAHHRHGGSGNAVASSLETTRHLHTAAGILATVETSAVAFESLAAEWSAEYQEARGPLLAWIEQARRSLEEDDA
jgi:predicted nucleotidyltransferase